MLKSLIDYNIMQKTETPLKHRSGVRVRVYAHLRIDQNLTSWQQTGTGHINFVSELSLEEENTQQYLTVSPMNGAPVSELALRLSKGKHTNFILYSLLDKNNRYEKLEATIISWEDKTLNYQVAVSFIEKGQCDDYWKLICSKVGKNYLEIGNLSPNDVLEMPNPNNLVYIMQNVKNRQDLISYHVMNKTQFMNSFKELVDQFDRDNNIQGLAWLNRITKAILNYNDTRILQVYFCAEYFPMYLKMLTHSESNSLRLKYVEIYKEKSVFSELVPLDSSLTAKIIMQNNILFFKGYILNLNTEAVLENYLNQLSHHNNLDIFAYIIKTKLVEQVAAQSQIQLNRVLAFLAELVALLKQLQEQLRIGIVDSIYESSIVPTLANIVKQDSPELNKLTILEVLGAVGTFGGAMFLEFLTNDSKQSPNLLQKYQHHLLHQNSNIQETIFYFLKQQLFCSHPQSRNNWIFLLRNNLLSPLIQTMVETKDQKLPNWLSCMYYTVDFTLWLSQTLGYMKIYELYKKFSLIEQCIPIFKTKSQKLVLIRIFKLAVKNRQQYSNEEELEFVTKYLLKCKLVQFIANIFAENHRKNNLLASSALESLSLVDQKNLISFAIQIKHIQKHLPLHPLIERIILKCPDGDEQEDETVQSRHKRVLENQEEQKYFEHDTITNIEKPEPKQIQTQALQDMLRMASQIGNKSQSEEENTKRKVKNTAPIQFNFQLSLEMEEEQG